MRVNLLAPHQAQEQTKQKVITKKNLWVAGLLMIATSIIVPHTSQSATNLTISAPTVLYPSPDQEVTIAKPVIKGVTPNDTNVDVYIDGVFNGKANVENGSQGTASWAYQTFAKFESGNHVVYAVARNMDETERSQESVHISFEVDTPYPTPILKGLVVNKNTQYTQPLVTGLAINGSTIEVFVDGKLDGELRVTNHESGTANFVYKPRQVLENGWHEIKARAKDSNGKTSAFTDSILFDIRPSLSAKASTRAPMLADVPHEPGNAVSAPTLFHPKSGSITKNSFPTITGLAHKGQTVEIFIDGSLNGTATMQSSNTDVISFFYNPFLPLKPGSHTASARAINENNQKSTQSNKLTFLVTKEQESFILSPQGVNREMSVKGQMTKNEGSQANADTKNGNNSDTQAEDKKSVSENSTKSDDKKTTPDNSSTSDSKTEKEGTGTSTDLIVIGDQATATAATTNGQGNTGVIIALAIAAIIIIGLISWFTSNRSESTPQEKQVAPEPWEPIESPPTSESQSEIWETEPINTPPPVTQKQDERGNLRDIPPPPPIQPS